MPPSEPAPVFSDPVIAVAATGHAWPPADRKIFDKGADIRSRIEKPGDVEHDYWIDLTSFIDEGDVITGASAVISPVTVPELAITRLEYRPSSVIMWLTGGKDGEAYGVELDVQTADGEARRFRFFVRTIGDATIYEAAVPSPGPAAVCAGIGPVLVASVDHIDFPQTQHGQQSQPVTVTIVNNGDAPAYLNAINAPAFLAVSSNTSGIVEPGESFDIQVAFAPASPGSYGGFVAIQSNGTEISFTTYGEGL